MAARNSYWQGKHGNDNNGTHYETMSKLGQSSQPQMQYANEGMSFFQRWKWGTWFAGIYLLVSTPCAIAYLLDRHEYSIPGFIVYYASLPTEFLLFQVFHPMMPHLERLPHGEALVLFVQLVVSTGLYFVVGQGIGRVVRRFARRNVNLKPGASA